MGESISRSQGQTCVLNARHGTVSAFTWSWAWRPKTVHLINGLVLSSIHHWNPDSRLRDQEGCHSRHLLKNPVHGIPRGVQHLLFSIEAGAQLEAVVSIDPSPSWGPSFSNVKMVCEMLLGNAEVLKRLLVTGFKGAFPSPAMKQLVRGI